MRKKFFVSSLIPLFSSLIFFSFLISAVHADTNPANDSANVEITIRPSIDRGISIDTSNVNMDLGLVDMNTATQTVRPATVTILGTVTNTELNLSAQITGGWSFDDVVTTTETDKIAVWAVFKSTTSATPPAKSGSDFDDAQDALNSGSPYFPPTRVGLAGGDTGNNDRFEDGLVNMDSLNPNTKRHLWFYLRTPLDTTTINEQRIQFMLTVVPGP